METRVLKAFVIVAEELNFRRAAERLNMSQPPLSRLITDLETDLGVKLFTRTTRVVELTGAGLHLLTKARDILTALETTEREVRALQKNKSGRLNLSLTSAAFHSDIPKLISSFKEQFPRMEVVMSENPVNTLTQNLKSGKVDIAFGFNELKDLANTTLQTHELGIMVPKDHPFAKRKSIKLSDLQYETIVFHAKNDRPGFQAEFLEYLKSKKITPLTYYRKPGESCGNLVRIGKGLLLTSKRMSHATPETLFIPLEQFSARLKIYATWSDDNESLALKSFLNFVKENTLVSASNGHF